jgi:hypothetical protein
LYHYILATDESQVYRSGDHLTTVLMNVRIRILATPRKGVVKYFSELVCGGKFWVIGLQLLSPLQFVLQERCTCDYCRKNCLELCRMYR